MNQASRRPAISGALGATCEFLITIIRWLRVLNVRRGIPHPPIPQHPAPFTPLTFRYTPPLPHPIGLHSFIFRSAPHKSTWNYHTDTVQEWVENFWLRNWVTGPEEPTTRAFTPGPRAKSGVTVRCSWTESLGRQSFLQNNKEVKDTGPTHKTYD